MKKKAILMAQVIVFLITVTYSSTQNPGSFPDPSERIEPSGLKTMIGKALFIDDVNRVVIIENSDGKQVKFSVVWAASITKKDGSVISINSISRKAPITVIYEKRKGQFVALSIVEENPQ